MQPEAVELLLDDDLVPWAAVYADLHEQGGVLHGLCAVAADDVGRATYQVVRVACAAHLVVQLVAAVAAAHPDGFVFAGLSRYPPLEFLPESASGKIFPEFTFPGRLHLSDGFHHVVVRFAYHLGDTMNVTLRSVRQNRRFPQ